MKKALTMLTAILICSLLAVPSALAAGEDWVLTDVIPEGGYYFIWPSDVDTDAAGNIYVADTINDRIKKYTPDGVLDTSWSGNGILGGVSGSGDDEFDDPAAIAVDAAGRLYVADSGNDRVKRYTPGGVRDVGWATAGIADGFDDPSGVAVDASGNLYVADSGNDCIKRYNSFGLLDTAWGSGGSIGSFGTAVDQFNSPEGIAIDVSSGKLYVADRSNHRIVRYDLDGTLDTTWGSGGMIGTGSYGSSVNDFYLPYGVAVDASGGLFVADTHNNRIKKYTSGGSLDTSWGSNGIIAGSGAENFSQPKGLVVDADGNLFVADTVNSRIKKYASDSTLDTAWCAGGIMAAYGSGAGQFNSPSDAVMDSRGRTYVADMMNSRIARYTSGGALDTAWGSGGYIGTGGSADDAFNLPRYVAVDSDDNLYVSDSGNNRIKRYTSQGVLDASWATGGILSDDLDFPIGIDVDGSGDLYVADSNHNCVKRYTPGGVRDTSWGGGDGIVGTGSNGSGADAFFTPMGLAVMPDGTVFVSDAGNNRIKAYTPQGELKTAWGVDGIVVGSAELGAFAMPYDLTINPDTGEVYVADTMNGRVISISPDGGDQELIWRPDGTPADTDNPFGNTFGIDYYDGRIVIVDSSQRLIVLTDVTGGVKLDDLTVFGETVLGFDPDTHEYTVVVSENATQVKIDATLKDMFSSVSGTGTLALNSGSSTQLKITVSTAAEGYSADYTLNVLRSGEDVGLTSLTVDGSNVSGFREDDTSYTVTAPYGARYVDIGAVGNSYCSEVAGAGVVKLTGDSTTFSVIAKAVDGSAKEYTLTVKKGSPEAATFDVLLDGKLLGIDGISVTVANDGSKTVLIRVTLSDGSYKEFPIKIAARGQDAAGSDTDDEDTTLAAATATIAPSDSGDDTEGIPDTGDKDTVAPAHSAVDIGLSPASAFAWWWIAIGVLALALAGAAWWIYILKKSIR